MRGSRRSPTAPCARSRLRPSRDDVLEGLSGPGPAGVRQAGATRILGRDRAGRRCLPSWGTALLGWPSSTISWRSSKRRRSVWRSNVRCSATASRSRRRPGEIMLAAGEQGVVRLRRQVHAGRDGADRAGAGFRRPCASGSGSSPCEAFPGVRLLWVRARRLLRRRRAGCSSTSSTRCPGSPRRACSASLFEASGIPYPELLDRLCPARLSSGTRRSAGTAISSPPYGQPHIAIESVAVVGAGFMGTGIAETVAVAGLPVIVHRSRWR